MSRTWSGALPPMAALIVSLLLTWLHATVVGGVAATGTIGGPALLVLAPIPLVVAMAWSMALLAGRPYWLAVIAAVIWLGVGLRWLAADLVWQMAGNVAAGLAAGLVVGLRWRLDRALALVSAALLPVLIWSFLEVPPRDQLQIFSDQMLEAVKDQMPDSAELKERERALAEQSRRFTKVAEVAVRIYPAVLVVGVLGQAGILLLAVWLIARRLVLIGPSNRWPPFTHWRLPFYLVWILVAGIGLMLTRQRVWADAGLNIVLVTGFLLSIQGVAVQAFVIARMMTAVFQVIFWTVMGVFFSPLLVISGVLLGLADQWLDLRRLHRPGDQDDDDRFGGAGSDDSTAGAGDDGNGNPTGS